MRFAKNESIIDRVIRIVAGIGLIGLSLAGIIGGPIAIVARVVAGIPLVTGATGFCPLYALLRVRTNAAEQA